MRDFDRVASALRDVDVVVNAAAMKQVPTCEYFPYEAVQTNIEGAGEHRPRHPEASICPVETVVGVSTDKACKPVNVMGMTKAIQERVFIQAQHALPEYPLRLRPLRQRARLARFRDPAVPRADPQRRAGDHHDARDDPLPAQPATMRWTRSSPRSRSAQPGETYMPERAVRQGSSTSPRRSIGDRPIETVDHRASGPGKRSTRSWSARRKRYRTVIGGSGTRSCRCFRSCAASVDEPGAEPGVQLR